MKQQTRVDEGFETIGTFVSKNFDNMLQTISEFKTKVQDESNRQSKLVETMSITVRELGATNKHLRTQQTHFEE